MSLDISTLFALATLVAALLGALLLYFGRKEEIAALNWWGAAYLMVAATITLWALSGSPESNLVSTIAGASGIFACGLIWNAARVFHGRQPTWFALCLGVAGWGVASVALSVDSGLRLSVGAIVVALLAGSASAELWSERRHTMHRRWPTLAVPMLHASLLLLPVLIGDLLAGAMPVVQSHWVKLFAVELVLYAIGTVFVIFMLVSERSVRAHKVIASTDPLTGLLNRRSFAEAAAQMMARSARQSKPVSLLMFDLDHFKSVNDGFGHAAGDEILRIFASTMKQTLRTSDLCGRLGGEEFVALLPCSVQEAAIAAERVRHAFATSDIAIDDVTIATTCSIGIADGVAPPDLEALLVAADAALYRAKRAGRNRIETSTGNNVTDGATRPDVARRPNVVRRARVLQEVGV